MKLGDLYRTLRSRQSGVSDNAGLEIQALFSAALAVPRAWVLAHPEIELSPQEIARIETAAARLAKGEPLPYILGRVEFYGLEFQVTPAVLIPRPETELLVETALAWLGSHPQAGWAVDIGTGTGCIAATLAVYYPLLRVAATDRSRPALRTAQVNCDRLGISRRVLLVECDLLPAFARQFDLICANLPYIPSQVAADLPVSRWEPRLALDGGEDGLDLIRRLLIQAPAALSAGGLALLEIEASQGAAALELARSAFPGADVRLIHDLSGRQRLIHIEGRPAEALR